MYHDLEMENRRNTNFEIKLFNEKHKNDNNYVKLPQDAVHRLGKYINCNELYT